MESNLSPRQKEELRRRLLREAACGCDENIACLLSSLAPDVATELLNTGDEQPYSGTMRTPLTSASYFGHANVVRLLVNDFKADVNLRDTGEPDDEKGKTALMLAAGRGHLEVVKVLVKAGCDINARQTFGETAVLHACQEGKLEVVQHLVENGADINLRSIDGSTCLLSACFPGKEALMRLLLEKGANPNDVVRYSERRRAGSKKTSSATPKAKPAGTFTTESGPFGGHSWELPLFLEFSRLTSELFQTVRTTALHRAVENHASDIVKLLLSHGAHVVPDGEGRTPWDIAMDKRFYDIVEILAGSAELPQKQRICSWEQLGMKSDSFSEAFRFLRLATEEQKKDLLDRTFQSCSALPANSGLEERVAPEKGGDALRSIMKRFVPYFYSVLTKGEILPFSNVQDFLEFCIQKAEHDQAVWGAPCWRDDEFLGLSLQAFLFGLKVAEGAEEEERLEQLACRLLPLTSVDPGAGSILHAAVYLLWGEKRSKARRMHFPFDRLLALLLKCGASVHAKDSLGNRPLHVVAFCPDTPEHSEMLVSMTRRLVEAGALVGVENQAGQTPLKLAQNFMVAEVLRSYYPPSLKSLAANEVVKNKIPFEGEIPQDLLGFVKLH